jgi:hypothetical protein
MATEDPAYSTDNRRTALQRAIAELRPQPPEFKHLAVSYKMTVVVERDELTDEQMHTLRERMRDLGNNAASGVELTMQIAGAPVTVNAVLEVDPC